MKRIILIALFLLMGLVPAVFGAEILLAGVAIGDESNPAGSYWLDANRIYRSRYMAVASGTLKRASLHINSEFATGFKIVIYGANGDANQDKKLAESDAINPATTGWLEVTFSGANQIEIEEGITYGLCYWFNSSFNLNRIDAANDGYKNATFNGAPSIWGWDASTPMKLVNINIYGEPLAGGILPMNKVRFHY